MKRAFVFTLIACVITAMGGMCTVGRADSVTFLGVDTTTQGNWVGTYGSAGYILNGFALTSVGADAAASPSNDVSKLPSYVSSYSYDANANQFLWASGLSAGLSTEPLYQTAAEVNADVRDLTDPTGAYREAACAFTVPFQQTDSSIITLASTTPANFKLSIYALDWDGIAPGYQYGTRTESFTVTAGNSSVTETISNFTGGKWLNFYITATAGESVTLTNNDANTNAVISAIMFEPVPEPSGLVALGGLGGVGLIGLVWRKRK